MISHAEILDSDQGHIFRKYRRKNNKKSVLFTGKRQKTARYQGICRQLLCIGLRPFLSYGRVRNQRVLRTRDIFDAKTLRANGAVVARLLTLNDGLYLEMDEKQMNTGKDGGGYYKQVPDILFNEMISFANRERQVIASNNNKT